MNSHWLAEQLLKYPNIPVWVSENDESEQQVAFSIDLIVENFKIVAICITGAD